MKRSLEVFLRDILASIEIIEGYTAGMSEVEFLRTLWVQDAVIRRLEIIGEAVKNLPPDYPTRSSTHGPGPALLHSGGLPARRIAAVGAARRSLSRA